MRGYAGAWRATVTPWAAGSGSVSRLLKRFGVRRNKCHSTDATSLKAVLHGYAGRGDPNRIAGLRYLARLLRIGRAGGVL